MKISKLEKISNQITQLRKDYNSLMLEGFYIQENTKEMQKIKNKLNFLHRRILLENQKYITEICKKCKVKSYTLTELLKNKNNKERKI